MLKEPAAAEDAVKQTLLAALKAREQTESPWLQLLTQAISGPLKGERLRMPPAHTTWHDWMQRHPDTLVLSTDTGYARDYTRAPTPVTRASTPKSG